MGGAAATTTTFQSISYSPKAYFGSLHLNLTTSVILPPLKTPENATEVNYKPFITEASEQEALQKLETMPLADRIAAVANDLDSRRALWHSRSDSVPVRQSVKPAPSRAVTQSRPLK